MHFFNISTSKSAPNPRFFLHFGFDMCFVPQRRAIIFLSADHVAPHPPLQRAYFLTLRSHKTLGKIQCFVTFYLFAHLDLLSSDTFSSLIFFLLPFPPDSLTSAFLSIYVPNIVGSLTLNFLRTVPECQKSMCDSKCYKAATSGARM